MIAHHDRSAHYLYGLWLALDVKSLDVVQMALDLEFARMWPPLFGIAEAYLPDLADAKRTAFLSTIPMSNFVGWSFFERYPERNALAGFYDSVRGRLSDEQRRAHLDRWLAKARAETVVLIDIAPTSPLVADRDERFASIPRLLPSIKRYRRIATHSVDELHAVVSIWRLVSELEAD